MQQQKTLVILVSIGWHHPVLQFADRQTAVNEILGTGSLIATRGGGGGGGYSPNMVNRVCAAEMGDFFEKKSYTWGMVLPKKIPKHGV